MKMIVHQTIGVYLPAGLLEVAYRAGGEITEGQLCLDKSFLPI
jgi:hypothetical protein